MPLASARHILVDSKEECETLKQQIAGGADFADLAAEHSLCPSAQEGGAAGRVRAGANGARVRQGRLYAPVGQVQGPVKTQFGWHLVEVTSRTK